MNYKRAKLQNVLLKILKNKSITGEIIEFQNSPSRYVYDNDLAESLGFTLEKLNYFLKGLEDDKFVNSIVYEDGVLKFLGINENGKDFIEHGGYIRKYFKKLFKDSITILFSTTALIFSGITAINGCNKEKQIQEKQEQTDKNLDKLSKSLDSLRHEQSKTSLKSSPKK